LSALATPGDLSCVSAPWDTGRSAAVAPRSSIIAASASAVKATAISIASRRRTAREICVWLAVLERLSLGHVGDDLARGVSKGCGGHVDRQTCLIGDRGVCGVLVEDLFEAVAFADLPVQPSVAFQYALEKHLAVNDPLDEEDQATDLPTRDNCLCHRPFLTGCEYVGVDEVDPFLSGGCDKFASQEAHDSPKCVCPERQHFTYSVDRDVVVENLEGLALGNCPRNGQLAHGRRAIEEDKPRRDHVESVCDAEDENARRASKPNRKAD
jgi:hypothetical protein